jgi:transcriptional regulator with XRE-family HTH domain
VARPASPTVRRRQLANVLRRLRHDSGMTLEQAAAVLEVSGATLSRIETGVRVPRSRDVRDLLDAYGVTDEARITEVTTLVAEARESGWWEAYSEVDDAYGTYIGLEAAANEIEQYESVVPAMLQTPEYLRAWLEEVVNPQRERPFSEHDIEKRVEVLLERQRLLQSPGGLKYSVVLDEGAFARTVGGDEVMRRQIQHMVEMAQLPSVSLRLLPLAAGAHPAQSAGPFTILSLPRDVSDVVYVDSLVVGQLFLENPADLSRCRRVFAALIAKSVTQEALLDVAATLTENAAPERALTDEAG